MQPAAPSEVKPMLCTLLKKPFTDPDYLFEVKWDGYRIIGHKHDKTLRLASRGGHNYSKKYPSVLSALKNLKHEVVLDGEIVYINVQGKPDFDALQSVNGQKAPVVFYVFDIMWLDGKNLMKLPLIERKKILKDVVGNNNVIRYSDDFDDGLKLFDHAQKLGLEGIIAKQRNSPYIPDDRSKKWYKIPTEIRQEFVIGGWIESQADRHFRTLLFGAYEGKHLKWVGHAGGGYKDKEMPGILKKLKSLEVAESPFVNKVDYDGVVHWVKPILVANIKYATFTKAGKIRKPAIFLGFREDKPAEQVLREVAKAHISNQKTLTASSDSNWPIVEALPVPSEETLELGDFQVKVHNVDKQIWKGVLKAELIRYYHTVSDVILPYLRNRPLSLYVKHQGPNAPGLYIKDMEGREPEFAHIFSTQRKHRKSGKRNTIDYLVCNNIATLLYLADLGCIDVNPWTSTTLHPEHPDYIIIDLDPSDKDFTKVIETAKAAKEFFAKHKLKAFPKTSGKTGMHLYLPCVGLTFPQARAIAENMCMQIHALVPDITTTEVSVSDRGTKLYLDPNQNDYTDTVAAPYSVRPYKLPTVSTPIQWKELNDLDPHAFTIHHIETRIEKKGDLFEGIHDHAIGSKNTRVLKKFL